MYWRAAEPIVARDYPDQAAQVRLPCNILRRCAVWTGGAVVLALSPCYPTWITKKQPAPPHQPQVKSILAMPAPDKKAYKELSKAYKAIVEAMGLVRGVGGGASCALRRNPSHNRCHAVRCAALLLSTANL
jgi:hypothetical protein